MHIQENPNFDTKTSKLKNNKEIRASLQYPEILYKQNGGTKQSSFLSFFFWMATSLKKKHSVQESYTDIPLKRGPTRGSKTKPPKRTAH